MKYLFSLFLCLIAATAFGAPFFQDGFETGNLTHSEGGTSWTSSVSVVGTDNGVTPATGSYMARFTTSSGQDLYFSLNNKSNVYLQYKVWIPSNFNPTSSGNNKMVRVWSGTYATSTNKQGASYRDYDDSGKLFRAFPETNTPGSAGASCSDATIGPISAWGYPEYRPDSTIKGAWHTWEWHFKEDSGAGDGAIQWWIDGTLVLDQSAKSWTSAPCSPGYFDQGYLFGATNSSWGETTYLYVDDVKFSDTYIGSDAAPSSTSSLRPGVSASGVTFR